MFSVPVVFRARAGHAAGMFRLHWTAFATMVTLLGGLGSSCGHPRRQINALRRAGDRTDDGTGQLAQASTGLGQLVAEPIAGDAQPEQPDPGTRRRGDVARNPWAADGTGGVTYGNYRTPELRAGAVVAPRYRIVDGDAAKVTGTIVGTVRWRGVLPTPLVTTCGAQAVVRRGPGEVLGGVVVSIDAPAQVFRDVVPLMEFEQRMDRVGCVMQPQLLVMQPAGETWIGNDESAAPFTVDGGAATAVTLAPFAAAPVSPTAELLTISSPGVVPGFVRVMATPLLSITDDKGRFVLEHVVPGSYQLRFWHPPIVELVAGQLRWGRPIEVRRQVTVRAGTVVDVTVALGRAGSSR